jgi:DNA-binding NarL/FixJ family response regulator
MSPIRILLVDDHEIVRRGIAGLLNSDKRFLVVAEAVDGDEALSRLEKIEADVAILDLAMPGKNGVETIRSIAASFPGTKMVVLSMHDSDQLIAQSLSDGAHAYVLKEAATDELISAIVRAMRGERYTVADVVRSERQKDRSELTDREREVLQLIVDGRTSREIAEILFISPHTASHHRTNLMRKLNAHSTMEVAQAAFRHGLAGLSKPPIES